jgi:hypothetical protein
VTSTPTIFSLLSDESDIAELLPASAAGNTKPSLSRMIGWKPSFTIEVREAEHPATLRTVRKAEPKNEPDPKINPPAG